MNYRGFLLFELLIAISIFSISLIGILFTLRVTEEILPNISIRLDASRKAQEELDRAYDLIKRDFFLENIATKYNDVRFTGSITIETENDASKMIISIINYKSFGKTHSLSYQRRITDPSLALGQSTCGDNFNQSDIQNINSFPIDNISLGISNIPTDIDVVGNYLFLTTDSSIQSDPDFFIFDIHNIFVPILISNLNTGPGANSLQVVGNYVFIANQSINGQLQVVDITNLYSPQLIKTIKLPGVYHDNTTVGNKVLYDNGRLYVATAKSSIQELHIYDANILSDPVWKSSFEINSGPNDLIGRLTSNQNLLYIATPSDPELIALDVTDISNPVQIDQFDAPTGSGNGKSLARDGNKLIFGRTVGNKDLYELSIEGSIKDDTSISVGSSINGIIYKNGFIFAITSKLDDSFQIYMASSSTINRVLNKKFILNSSAKAIDCDSKNFYVLTSDPLHPLVLFN